MFAVPFLQWHQIVLVQWRLLLNIHVVCYRCVVLWCPCMLLYKFEVVEGIYSLGFSIRAKWQVITIINNNIALNSGCLLIRRLCCWLFVIVTAIITGIDDSTTLMRKWICHIVFLLILLVHLRLAVHFLYLVQ